MFVPCPHCGFLVVLIVGRGDAARPCPRCGKALDAEVVAAMSAEPVAPDQDSVPARAAMPLLADEPTSPPNATVAADPVASTRSIDATDSPHHAALRHPSFLRTIATPTRPDGRRWPWIVAAWVLGAALMLQLLLLQRADLAANERWRPVITTVCAALGCEVPLWHQPSAYTMLARDVRPVSPGSAVLKVHASFRNDAHLPQAWPVLHLQLTDVNGQAVAARMLQPADYHSGAPHAATLASGQSASVSFQIAEPATPIVAFNFEFL